MSRLLALVVLVVVPVLAWAQGPTVVSGVQTQEGTAITPQPFHHAVAPDPNWSAAELESRADILRGQKSYADAVDYYQAALKKAPDRAMLWNKLGIAELQLMRYDDARKDFERALKIDKKLPEALNNLGVIHYVQQNYRKAIKLYRKAIEIRPEAASFHSNLANAYFSRKDFDKANEEYLRAVELDPDILERQSTGGIQARLGAPRDRARYSFYIARLYAHTGNLDRALHYLRLAMEDGYPEIDAVYKDQEFAALRKDPRFQDLMISRPQTLPQ